jgi:methyl-accepting chemotaxis protein
MINLATAGVDKELVGSTDSGDRQAATSNMRMVLGDIAAMQQRFADSTLKLQEIIDGVKNGHQDIVARLADALGQVQFQDVMRQRVEQVQHALQELDGHLVDVADHLLDQHGVQAVMVPLKERLEQHQASYVMQSQRATHDSVIGNLQSEEAAAPRIDLF